MSSGRVTVSDGWHPTVNPSARLPIHHYRFLQLLGHRTRQGVLNEIPRRRGGCTLRLVRRHPTTPERVQVTALPGPRVEWMPWWLPAADRWAVGVVADIYRAALRDPRPTSTEKTVYERVLDEFETRCTAHTEHTVGEALHYVMDAEQRRLDPDLPRLHLFSMTHSPVRHLLAAALASLPDGLVDVLCRWAVVEQQPVWALGVATSRLGAPLMLRLHVSGPELRLDALDCDGTGRRHGRAKPVTTGEVADLIDQGRLVPGSRLTTLAEITLALAGWQVRHYGNTYGRLTAAARILDPPIDLGDLPVIWWSDDHDSWHYADLATGGGSRYPLHLLDVLARPDQARGRVPDLIANSLRTGGPVAVEAGDALVAVPD